MAQKNKLCTLVFAEASWNVKEEKLMNKLYTGIIEASKVTCTDIVPLVFIYVGDKCYCKIGDPIKVDKNKDSRLQADELRDIMATMMLVLLEEKTNFYPERKILKEIELLADNWDKLPDSKMKRLINLKNELCNVKENAKKEFYDNVEKNWNECLGLDKEFEAKCIYRDEDSPVEVFEHLNNIKINDKTKFLFNPNIIGYTKPIH